MIVQAENSRIDDDDDDASDDEDEDIDVISSTNPLVRLVVWFQTTTKSFYHRHKQPIKLTVTVLFVMAYFTYFGYAMYFRFGDEGSVRLLWVTCLVVAILGLQAAHYCFRLLKIPLPVDWVPIRYCREHEVAINWSATSLRRTVACSCCKGSTAIVDDVRSA